MLNVIIQSGTSHARRSSPRVLRAFLRAPLSVFLLHLSVPPDAFLWTCSQSHAIPSLLSLVHLALAYANPSLWGQQEGRSASISTAVLITNWTDLGPGPRYVRAAQVEYLFWPMVLSCIRFPSSDYGRFSRISVVERPRFNYLGGQGSFLVHGAPAPRVLCGDDEQRVNAPRSLNTGSLHRSNSNVR
jgi:hypothetical protein